MKPPSRQAATLSGWPSISRGHGEQLGPVSRAVAGERRRGQHRRHDRGGRGAEPTAVRDVVGAAQRQPGWARAPNRSKAARSVRTTRCEASRAARPAPSPVTSHRQARRVGVHPRPSPRRTGRAPARGQSKPGPRFALVAGTRTVTESGSPRHPAHVTGARTRLTSQAERGRRCPDVGRHRRRCVTTRPDSAVSASLSPLPVTVHTTSWPGLEQALVVALQQPRHGRRRRPARRRRPPASREQPLRGEDLLVGDRLDDGPPDSSRAATALGPTTPGRRCGSPWRRCPGRRPGARTRSVPHPRPGSPTSWAASSGPSSAYST